MYPSKFVSCSHSRQLLANGIRAKVRKIRARGQELGSALITKRTQLTFRSRSADTYVILEMSKEMFEFDTNVQGGLLYF